MAPDIAESKNWPGTKWETKKNNFVDAAPHPNIILPKIQDLAISKELALSKTLKLPEMGFRANSDTDKEEYVGLSALFRTNIFPGGERIIKTSNYVENYPDPFKEPLFRPVKSTHDFRRKKQAFCNDLEFKRLQAAWKEFTENQKTLINWEDKMKESKPKPRRVKEPAPEPPRKPLPKRKKKLPPPPPPNETVPSIPDPDMGGMDIFMSHNTPDWAKGSDSISEELDKPEIDNDEFWAMYNDPF